tara:strand:- start:205 stop:444 length:240 start_codon:yes stop_codon:yes gene_type:complete
MKKFFFYGISSVLLILPGLPLIAGYPESPGMGCRFGYIKTNNNTYCADINNDSGYPESPYMGCHYGFRKVNNNTYCTRF